MYTMNIRGFNRWQAFLAHLGISLIIFIALLAVITLTWYPGVFIHMGGWQGIKIVAAVDLVLGPVLTLIVFNPTKKSLPIDLSIIAIIQLSCLGYGVWAVEQQRPLTQVLFDDTLYVIPKAQYKAQNISLDFMGTLSGPTPKKVILNLPNDPVTIAQNVIMGLLNDTPPQLNTTKYIPISSEPSLSNKEKINKLLTRLDYNKPDDCFWITADSNHLSGELCFSIDNGAIKYRESTKL